MSSLVETNWRLVLLGVTSAVLSIASGWTTLDGMSNFTNAPVLSFLITFGIQSVMLISAWMLGEAVVNRFHGVKSGRRAALTALFFFLAFLVASSVVFFTAVLPYFTDHVTTAPNLSHWVGPTVGVSVIFCTVAIVLRFWSSNNPARALFSAAMLAVMFTVCMITSVFFSFDSLFSTVFPESERRRVSEIRARSLTDGVLNDLMIIALESRVVEKTRVLESPAWRTFSRGIDTLRSRMADQRSTLGQEVVALTEQRRKAAQVVLRERAALDVRRESARRHEANLRADLERLVAKRTELQSENEKLDSKIFANTQMLQKTEVRAQAEESGLSQSQTRGRGPLYKALVQNIELAKIELNGLQDERVAIQKHIAEIERKIDELDEELFKKSVEVTTAENDISALDLKSSGSGVLAGNELVRSELASKSSALIAARAGFDQSVMKESLDSLGQACRAAAEVLKRAGGDVDGACSTADVTLAAAQVFKLNAGVEALSAKCSILAGKNVPDGSVEGLVTGARGCLQLAELPSEAAESLRRRLDNIERNRDDRAHRFIVTINAFQDGNKLAYLALAIALSIDGLVFVSGLLAAASRASPFRSLPGAAGHTVASADRIMRSALLPDPGKAASLILSVIQPITSTSESQREGFTHQLDFGDPRIRKLPELRRLINAAAGIGAALTTDVSLQVYQLRREIVDFLAQHLSSPDLRRRKGATPSTGQERIGEAICGASPGAVRKFGKYMRPAEPDGAFVCNIDLANVGEKDRADVLNVLNAAAIGGFLRPDAGNGSGYRISREFAAVVLEAISEAEPNNNENTASVVRPQSIQADITSASDAKHLEPALGMSGEVASAETEHSNGQSDLRFAPKCMDLDAGERAVKVSVVRRLRSPPVCNRGAKPAQDAWPDNPKENAEHLKVKIVGDTMQFE